ncbi:D-2-hydroxyacid dehydrogenase [Belnapia sp. T6]|uniref:D-2-hydroxyacid dehydrogenase n=1 Tax=Belnapia mucosa TaxID=2804532 RepID=A0ABS1V4I8_9PROT|nr:D-2-hydroxyacid dehydrogenase [Belnapia mucosa]MBL6456615.1 D-2-hydroxyacid dehydrogenase [Belnapia mucosa]
MRLLLSDVAADRHGARIRAAVPGVGLVPVVAEGPLPETAGIGTAFITRDLFLGGTRHRLTPRFQRFVDLVLAAPDLRRVQTFSAGTDMAPYQAMRARGIEVVNAAGASAVPVAQSAIAGLLALARRLPAVMAAQRRHAWEPLYGAMEPRDLNGQLALVIGTGPIGQEIARLSAVFGLHPVGIRRDAAAPPPPGFAETASFAALPTLLPRADWLILACPLTETTRNLVDAAALALLPPGAQLVNVARGGVVEEAALLEALRSGHLAGAFIDVFTAEPLPPDSPFWDLPNVIVSPHSAAASDGLAERVAEIACRNFARWAAEA